MDDGGKIKNGSRSGDVEFVNVWGFHAYPLLEEFNGQKVVHKKLDRSADICKVGESFASVL